LDISVLKSKLSTLTMKAVFNYISVTDERIIITNNYRSNHPTIH
jgi:hypothetical protein